MTSLKPMVTGHNNGFMTQAFFPRAALEAMLPEHLAIPDDATMARYYPGIGLDSDTHPFMLSFCHGSGIHDVYTNVSVPQQQEIMFVFPVTYTHDDGAAHLSSYVPVLYLDSLLGMVGGLYFGLRKEYHPQMEHGEDSEDTRWWRLDDILDASFEPKFEEDMDKLPDFYEQIFSSPFVTASYRLPFSRLVFYQARVYPDVVCSASAQFSWNYGGEAVKNSAKGSAIFSEYSFTMSRSMNGKRFFGRR